MGTMGGDKDGREGCKPTALDKLESTLPEQLRIPQSIIV